jgi:oxygen-independent coproporphyrinogen-3 oxidase
VVTKNILSDADLRAEALFLGMRLLHGVNILDYRRTFGVDLRVEHCEDLDRFCEAGLIEFDGHLLRLTRAGALMSNEVFAALI